MPIAGERLPLEELLSLSCDVLIPAAIPDVITEEVAATLDCKYVVEAANGPTTPEGDKVLRERGIGVLPDVYANGGARLIYHQPFEGRVMTPAFRCPESCEQDASHSVQLS